MFRILSLSACRVTSEGRCDSPCCELLVSGAQELSIYRRWGGVAVNESYPRGNVYRKYGTDHPLERRLVRNFLRSLAFALPGHHPRVVVEIGMGEGEISQLVQARYPDSLVLGVDLPDARLRSEWKMRQLVGVFGDATGLPLADKTADLVLAVELLEHVRDPSLVLRELLRVASGPVVLSVPREPVWRIGNILRRRYLRAFGNTPGHLNHWSRRSFVRFVTLHATVVEVHSPLPWTIVVATP